MQAGKELVARVDLRRNGRIFILTLRLQAVTVSPGEAD